MLTLRHQNFSEYVTLEKDGYEGLAAALQQGWEKICKEVAIQIDGLQTQAD